MATNNFLQKSVGQWKGESKLHLSWLEDESKRVQPGASELHIDLDDKKMYATLTYWWTYEGERQEGIMTIICDEKRKKSFIGWVDAWHMNYDVMRFEGELEVDRISGFGKYYVGDEHPEWGWRITLEMDGEKLKVKMDNVSPEGESEWAVEGTYSRS